MPLASPAATVVAVVEAAASSVAPSSPSPSPSASSPVSPLSAAAMESVKRKGRQLSSDFTQFVTAMAQKDSPDVSIPLEFKLLAALVVLFLFLVFLIAVLWDRYGKELGELYTPTAAGAGGDSNDANPHDVADEYTVYQKLPTFFYEYVPRKKQQ